MAAVLCLLTAWPAGPAAAQPPGEESAARRDEPEGERGDDASSRVSADDPSAGPRQQDGDDVPATPPGEDWDPLMDQDFEEAEKAARKAARQAARQEACPSPDLSQSEAIDKVHKGIYKAVCASAFWFDSLFGDVRIDEQREDTYGRLLVGLRYNEPDGLRDEIDFRAQVTLPTMERRLRAFASRGDAGELLSDTTETRIPSNNPALALPDDDEWLIGLGYSPPGRHGGDFDFDVGLDLDFPSEPFVKARYSYNHFFSDRSLLRVRQTLFWEREDGYGTTNRADWEYLFSQERLLRARTSLRISEIIDGLDWYGELTLFTQGSGRNALGYQVAATGETEAEVTLRRYVARVIYRRRLHRDWFFLDVRPGVAWARREGDLKREFEPVLLIGTEILFGERERRRP